jgi:hypothetical protein
MDLRARVFVSCGQSAGTDEVEVARQVAARLTALGFEPYVAVEEQTLRGLKENIFGRLAASEYFVFIDMKRERLAGSEPPVHRGSLFCHQELALAAYLDLPVIALQEVGTKPEDGILRFMQTNAVRFTDRHLVPAVVADLTAERKWRSDWRNELTLERDPRQSVDAALAGSAKVGRFFHIGVRNLNPHKAARNCHVFLEEATRLEPLTRIPLETVEFKWAGSPLPYVTIGPGACRHFDAVWCVHDDPTAPQFSVHTISTQFIPAIHGSGEYRLAYVVMSENFAPARGVFRLSVQPSLEGFSLADDTGINAA